MKISKRFLGLFLTLQFLFSGTSFSNNLVDLAKGTVTEAIEVELASTNSDAVENNREVDFFTTESESAQDTSVSESTNNNDTTEAIATNASAERTKDLGRHKPDCEKARPKISVIVPVYKVEPWIRECLDSLKNQTLKEIEIICVDDGSPDNCGAILEEYAANDDRFIIIHKENNGVQEARNDGLARATGEYITFVDSDDYLQLDAYEVAYNAAKKDDVDILEFDHRRFDDGNDNHKIENNDYSKQDVIGRKEYLNLRNGNYVWDKLFKAELIKKDNVKFIKGIRPADDTCFAYMVLGRAKKMKAIPTKLYNYRIRAGALSRMGYRNAFLNSYRMLKLISDDWKRGDYTKNSEDILLFALTRWVSWFSNVALCFAKEILNSFGPDIYNPTVVKRCDKRTQQLIRELEDAAAHPEKNTKIPPTAKSHCISPEKSSPSPAKVCSKADCMNISTTKDY